MDKVLNFFLIALCGTIVYLSHLDRSLFLNELKDTRELYVQTMTNVLSDMTEIKADLKEIKYILGGDK